MGVSPSGASCIISERSAQDAALLASAEEQVGPAGGLLLLLISAGATITDFSRFLFFCKITSPSQTGSLFSGCHTSPCSQGSHGQ